MRNYRAKPMQLEAALVVPAGWKIAPEIVKLTVPANGGARESFEMTVPAGWNRAAHPRVAIAADVEADGQYLGEIAEGVVDIL